MIAKIEQTERKLAEESLGEILIDMARIAEVYPSMPHDLSGESMCINMMREEWEVLNMEIGNWIHEDRKGLQFEMPGRSRDSLNTNSLTIIEKFIVQYSTVAYGLYGAGFILMGKDKPDDVPEFLNGIFDVMKDKHNAGDLS